MKKELNRADLRALEARAAAGLGGHGSYDDIVEDILQRYPKGLKVEEIVDIFRKDLETDVTTVAVEAARSIVMVSLRHLEERGCITGGASNGVWVMKQ